MSQFPLIHTTNGSEDTTKIKIQSSPNERKATMRRFRLLRALMWLFEESGKVTHGRLLAWRGAAVTVGLLFLLGIAAFSYIRVHQYDLTRVFETGDFPSLRFVRGEGYTRIAVELAFGSFLGVLIRRLISAARDARRADFDLVVHFSETTAEAIGVPVVCVFIGFLVSLLHIKLGVSQIELSFDTADVWMLLAIGFLLGFIGSRHVIRLLLEFRDRLLSLTAKPSPQRRSPKRRRKAQA